MATGLMNGGEWGWTAAKDGYLVIKRGEVNKPLPPEFYSFTRAENPRIDKPMSVTFADSIQLVGYSISPGEVLHQKDGGARLRFYFRAIGPVKADYLVGIVALANTEVISSQYWFPTTLWLPMTKWPQGDLMVVEVPRVALAGQPWIDVYLTLHEPLKDNQPGAKVPLRIEQLTANPEMPAAEENQIPVVRLRGEYW
jgi:hypothetical protein